VVSDTIESRAPTERFGGDATIPLARGTGPGPMAPSRQAMTPPPVTTKASGDRNVSAAFDAIMVADDRGSLAEVPGEDGAVEIRSEAPGSAPLPPGDRPGVYAQHRRRDSGSMSELERDKTIPPPMSGPAGPPSAPPSRPTPKPPPSQASTPPLSRGASPMSRPPTQPPPRPSAPLPTYPSGGPASPSAPQRAQTQSRTRSPSGGGVVVTRPAVIIGAPARTVGGGAPATPPAPQNPPPAVSRTTSTRVRKAREDSDSGLFGQDLISEKSLDEVILAYLSEDPAEE
jgi:hypothetical protein